MLLGVLLLVGVGVVAAVVVVVIARPSTSKAVRQILVDTCGILHDTPLSFMACSIQVQAGGRYFWGIIRLSFESYNI